MQVLVACALTFGITHAAATNLGGSNVTPLGAGDDVIAACDADGIDVTFDPAFDPTDGRHEVLGVRVSALDAACNGQTIDATVQDENGNPLATGTGAVVGPVVLLPLDTPPAVTDAAAVALVVR